MDYMKIILNEISIIKTKGNAPMSFFDAIDSMFKRRDESPILNDLVVATTSISQLIKDASKAINSTIAAIAKQEPTEIEKKHLHNFLNATENFTYIMNAWARKIDSTDKNKRNDIHRIMEDLRTHVQQITLQAREVVSDVKTYKNYINAVRKLRHLNEIFKNLKRDSNELFKLALSVGIGQTKQK